MGAEEVQSYKWYCEFEAHFFYTFFLFFLRKSLRVSSTLHIHLVSFIKCFEEKSICTKRHFNNVITHHCRFFVSFLWSCFIHYGPEPSKTIYYYTKDVQAISQCTLKTSKLLVQQRAYALCFEHFCLDFMRL